MLRRMAPFTVQFLSAALPIADLLHGPVANRAWIFVPPTGGEAVFYISREGPERRAETLPQGTGVETIAVPACGELRTRVRARGEEGYVSTGFLLRDFECEPVPHGDWYLLRWVASRGRPDCGETAGERVGFYSVSAEGAVIDASPQCGWATVYDPATGAFEPELLAGTTVHVQPVAGVTIFSAAEGKALAQSSAVGEAPALTPNRRELIFRDPKRGAVRLFPVPGGVGEEVLADTSSRGPPEPVRFEAGGTRMIVPLGEGNVATFRRAESTVYLVLLAATKDRAQAHRALVEGRAVLRDPPILVDSALYPPFRPGYWLVVARECSELGEAEVIRGNLKGLGFEPIVRTARIPGWESAQ